MIPTESLSKIEKAYDSPPIWYDIRGFFVLTFAYRSTLWAQISLFGNNIGARHLEGAVGSGTLFGIILAWKKITGHPIHAEIVGFDYAPSMLAGAIRRFKGMPGIRLIQADVAALDLPHDYFDTANIANAIHCFPDVVAGLTEVCRVLKPGGRLAVNVLLYPRGVQPFKWISERINAWAIRKGILYTPYDQADIRSRIVNAGFDIESEKVAGNTLNVIAVKRSA
ncbi:MAG: methyltransferase domain-containing protein [Rhodoferax sp.]|nr:methyltransferase domain-containing protein [Rhodoferax sp.]